LGFPASLSACGGSTQFKRRIRRNATITFRYTVQGHASDKGSLSDVHMSLLCLIVEDEYLEAMQKHRWLTVNHKPNCRSVRKGDDCDCKPTMQATDAFLDTPEDDVQQFHAELVARRLAN
jgi:hypothetical protein